MTYDWLREARRRAPVLAFGIALLTACGGAQPNDEMMGVQAIFTARCATSGCHGGASMSAPMSLERGQSRQNLVNVDTVAYCAGQKRVVPGDPDASCLMLLVEIGTMPRDREPLTQAQVDTIREWIAAGAPE